MTDKSRIRWTAEERSVVVATMAKLLSKGAFSSRAQLLRDAQNTLPLNRRRYSFSHEDLKEMNAKAHELSTSYMRSVGTEQGDNEPKPEVAPVPLPLLEPRDIANELLELLIDKIADKVADRLAARLQVQVQTTTTTHSEPRPKHNPEPFCNAPREPKIGVLILGIQPHQAHLIKQEFPQLDITCYDSDEARTKPVLRRAHVIAMTRFLSHQVDELYRKSPCYHRHLTGTSELKTLLTRIQKGEV